MSLVKYRTYTSLLDEKGRFDLPEKAIVISIADVPSRGGTNVVFMMREDDWRVEFPDEAAKEDLLNEAEAKNVQEGNSKDAS